MPAPATTTSGTMTDLVLPNQKVVLSDLGMEVTEALSFEEWLEVGAKIGRVQRATGFMLGDWLVYGERRFGQRTFWPDIPTADMIYRKVYEAAANLHGMDWQTLQTYAYVSRNVPLSLRNESLSWEHHKKVAKLKNDFEKTKWLNLAAEMKRAKKPVSTRRLARSIEAGRLLSRDEMRPDETDRGIENCHPYVNGIVAFFGKLRRAGWFESASPEKRAALKSDLQPVVDLYSEL